MLLHQYITQDDINDKKILDKIEKEADMFAGAFLLPAKSFSKGGVFFIIRQYDYVKKEDGKFLFLV